MDKEIKRILRCELLVGLMAIVCFFAFDVYPLMSDMGGLSKKVKAARRAARSVPKEAKERQRKKLEEELSALQKDFGLLKKVASEIKKRAVDTEDIPLVGLEMEDLSSAANIDLVSMKHLDSKKRHGYEFLPIEISFNNEYTELLDFLTKIESSKMMMAVHNLTVTKDPDIYPKLNVHLTVYALFFPHGSEGELGPEVVEDKKAGDAPRGNL